MTTIHTLKDALALADHNGHLVVDGDLQIACTLGYKPWSNEDATGLSITARNIIGKEDLAGEFTKVISVHEINVSGIVTGFASVSAQHIHVAGILTAENIHARSARGGRFECDTVFLYDPPDPGLEIEAFMGHVPAPEPTKNLSQIITEQYKDMPVFSRRSFI